jgi:hypothetical protein
MDTIAGIASRRQDPDVEYDTDEEEFNEKRHRPHLDHSKDFANHVLKNISGRGMKYDSPAAHQQIMSVLQGAGLSDIRRAYVTGRVPRKRTRRKPKPVRKFHNVDHPGGGSLFRPVKYSSDGDHLSQNAEAIKQYVVL